MMCGTTRMVHYTPDGLQLGQTSVPRTGCVLGASIIMAFGVILAQAGSFPSQRFFGAPFEFCNLGDGVNNYNQFESVALLCCKKIHIQRRPIFFAIPTFMLTTIAQNNCSINVSVIDRIGGARSAIGRIAGAAARTVQ